MRNDAKHNGVSCNLPGAAYAVLDQKGTLTFVRSMNHIENKSVGCVRGRTGRLYSGIVFTGFEEESYEIVPADSNNPPSQVISSAPWARYSVRKVVFEDAIRPLSTSCWFAGRGQYEQFNLKGLDTSRVTDMSYMFSRQYAEDCCYGPTELDLSGFDTSMVRDMSWMFGGCLVLSSVDISGWDTSRVEDMSLMFAHCYSLRSVDVSHFDTSRVADMTGMFEESGIERLDLSGFDLSKTAAIRGMLWQCDCLRYLKIPEWEPAMIATLRTMLLRPQ